MKKSVILLFLLSVTVNVFGIIDEDIVPADEYAYYSDLKLKDESTNADLDTFYKELDERYSNGPQANNDYDDIINAPKKEVKQGFSFYRTSWKTDDLLHGDDSKNVNVEDRRYESPTRRRSRRKKADSRPWYTKRRYYGRRVGR